MATQKQIDANRANAQKSSGPRTPEGKAASRFNALKHGVHAESQCIPGEDPAELEALAHGYYDELQPQGPIQQHFVDRLVLCDWLRRRYHKIQAELIEQLAFEVEQRSEDDESRVLAGQAFLRSTRHSNDALVKLFRQINANDRTYDRALATLQSLRAAPAPSRTPFSTERTQIEHPDPPPAQATLTEQMSPQCPVGRSPSEPADPSPATRPVVLWKRQIKQDPPNARVAPPPLGLGLSFPGCRTDNFLAAL